MYIVMAIYGYIRMHPSQTRTKLNSTNYIRFINGYSNNFKQTIYNMIIVIAV